MKTTGRAFTLLEMMLAISLLALVIAIALGMLHGGMTARRAVSQGTLQTRRLALALEQICRSLQSVLPPTGALAGEFVGECADDSRHDTVTFHTSLDGQTDRWGDVRRLRFFVTTDEAGTACLMRGQVNNLLSPTAPAEETFILCRSVASLQLRYFDGADWRDDWNSTERENTLPSAVRVSLTLEDEGRTDGPTMERIVLLTCSAPAQGGAR